MGHPDFRVAGKIFATLGWPDRACAMVKLTPEQQATFIARAPKIFVPVPGGWGLRGSTNVRLAAADDAALEGAVAAAWRNAAPKPLATRLDESRARPERVGAPARGLAQADDARSSTRKEARKR